MTLNSTWVWYGFHCLYIPAGNTGLASLAGRGPCGLKDLRAGRQQQGGGRQCKQRHVWSSAARAASGRKMPGNRWRAGQCQRGGRSANGCVYPVRHDGGVDLLPHGCARPPVPDIDRHLARQAARVPRAPWPGWVQAPRSDAGLLPSRRRDPPPRGTDARRHRIARTWPPLAGHVGQRGVPRPAGVEPAPRIEAMAQGLDRHCRPGRPARHARWPNGRARTAWPYAACRPRLAWWA